jgi:hypothetical protein
MSGKEITKDDLKQAVTKYASQNDLTVSESENGFCLMPGDVMVSLEKGKPKCASQSIKEGIYEIILDMIEEAPKGSNLAVRSSGRITSRSQAGSVPGSALSEVRACQATEKPSYSTGGGKRAASAKTNIAALIQAGGSLEILAMTHNKDYIEYHVRAVMGSQHVDSSMAVDRMQYLAKKAWDWIPKYAIEDPTLVIGTDENLLPTFREGAVIKTRVRDGENSLVVPLPAPIAMFKELAREWQSAGRVCETKAYNRAADMILRQDFQSREELAEEQSEVDAIRGA